MAKEDSTHRQLYLILHTAADYRHRGGVGMGVIQRAECIFTGAARNDQILNRERKFSYSRKQLVLHNMKTTMRSHILALVHAIGMARRTVRENRSVREVTIFSNSPLTVQTVNYYHHEPTGLENVSSTNDRCMIKKIVTKIQELSRYDIRVTVAVTGETDEAKENSKIGREQDKADKRSKRMARQGGRKAWKGRLRRRDFVKGIQPEATE